MCKELNYLITCTSNGLVRVFDLESKGLVREMKNYAKTGVYGIDLEREVVTSGQQFNLILSMEDNTVYKLNFSEMMKGAEYDSALLWVCPISYSHIWSIRHFKTELYAIDYGARIFVLDLKTGKENTDIKVDISNGAVDMVFTPEEEMIVCGVNILKIFKFNYATQQWELSKSYQPKNDAEKLYRCFGVWYERISQLIYVTDANGTTTILDKELKFLKQISTDGSPYGILINDKNGELLVLESNQKTITIYK